MKILVTGGAGFIGSCLVEELLGGGNEALVFDNFSVGRSDWLPADNPRLAIVEGDIVDHAHLLRVMDNWRPQVVIHLAGIHFIPYCNAHRMETLRVNVEGTQSVLEACGEAQVERIVIASSAAVYGISDQVNCESDPPAPVDVYGLSKWCDEALLCQFHQDSGVSCIAARLFNVYGPHETNPHVIPQILEQMLTADEIHLGNLDAYRDFVYVRDVAQALIALAKAKNIDYGIFNVGTGTEHSIQDVLATCEDIMGRELRVRSIASLRRRTDRWHLRADCSHMSTVIGWRARYDLHTGLAETIRAMSVPVPA